MAQRDPGMRMLINDEEDEEDDEDEDEDEDDEDEDDEDEDEEDEDDEDEDEDENEDDDPLPAWNLLSRGDRTWACRKVSGFPLVLLPAYSLLKQEQLQLAQPAFVAFPKMFKGHFFLMFVHWKRAVQIPFLWRKMEKLCN